MMLHFEFGFWLVPLLWTILVFALAFALVRSKSHWLLGPVAAVINVAICALALISALSVWVGWALLLR